MVTRADTKADVQRVNATLRARLESVLKGVGDEAFRSIVHGSAITGAPGQPVAREGANAGKLRDSWTKVRRGLNEIVISTDVEYAEEVEHNIHGFVFANHGPHSVKLTAAGAGVLVESVVRTVVGGGKVEESGALLAEGMVADNG